jgi:hypothetical protein
MGEQERRWTAHVREALKRVIAIIVLVLPSTVALDAALAQRRAKPDCDFETTIGNRFRITASLGVLDMVGIRKGNLKEYWSVYDSIQEGKEIKFRHNTEEKTFYVPTLLLDNRDDGELGLPLWDDEMIAYFESLGLRTVVTYTWSIDGIARGTRRFSPHRQDGYFTLSGEFTELAEALRQNAQRYSFEIKFPDGKTLTKVELPLTDLRNAITTAKRAVATLHQRLRRGECKLSDPDFLDF